MASREDLKSWVLQPLVDLKSAYVPVVAKHVWDNHERDLRASGDLFYTWQYAMRWEAQKLQHEGKIKKVGKSGLWEIV